MTEKKTKGANLLRELALREIVGVIRKRGAASVAEIQADTGRSRGNVDGYLTELVNGGHVLKGLPPVAARRGATFVYTAPEGQVRELPASDAAGGQGGALVVQASQQAPDYRQIEQRVLAHMASTFTKDKAANVLRLIDAGQLTFEQAVGIGLVPMGYTEQQIRAELDVIEAPFSPLQVVPESRGRPIPAHPNVYRSESQCTPPEPGDSDEIEQAVCGVQYETHARVTCSEMGRSQCETCPGEYAVTPSTSQSPRAKGGGQWRGGYTHLSKGGDFELRELGGGKVEVRRVLDGTARGAPAVVDTSFALANFIQKPPAKAPSSPKDAGEVWVTPKPLAVQPPLPAKPVPLEGGHFGMGSGKAKVIEPPDMDEDGGES